MGCVFALGVTGCTETPGYLPPCSDPQVDCPPLDGSADGAAEGGKQKDASRDASAAD